MKKKSQLGFFDIAERTAKLARMGDPLVGLNEQIDWEVFRADLNRVHAKARKSNADAKPSMSCSCSSCWYCNNSTTCPMTGLNTRYATDSPSCAFWDCSLKIASRTPSLS